MLPKIRLTLLVIVLSYSHVLALQSDYDLFTTREGLPHNNILSVIQDTDGFIWLGTYNGLCMYDGQEFRHYPEIYTKKNNSWENVINTLFEDSEHNIWVGSWDGSINCYVRRNQKFIRYKSSIQNSKANCIYQDSNKHIWIGYSNGSIGLVQNDSIHIKSICDKNIWNIKEVGTNRLFLVTEERLYKYNTINKKLTTVPIYKNMITFDSKSNENSFLILNDKGVTNINIEETISENHIPHILNNKSTAYMKIALANSSDFYVTDGYNIYKYTKDLELLDSFYVSDNISYYKGTIVNQFIEDRSGIFWLATTTGLLKIDKHKKQFSIYNNNSSITTLTHNYIRTLFIDKKNNLWVGFRYGKINKLTYNKKKKHYVLSNVYSINTPYKNLTNAYTVNTILQTKEGIVLYGGEQGVLYLSKNGVFEYLLPKQYHDVVVQVWSLFEDQNGNIWIGTKGKGLYIYNKHDKSLYNYQHEYSQHTSLSHNDVWKIYKDKKDRVWIGTKNGLDYINDIENISQLKFSHHTISGHNISNAWSIVQDNNNNIWIGTTESGLYKISANLVETSHIESLIGQAISGLVVDANNTLWISTINGMYKHASGEDIIFFDESEGLVSSDFNFNAAAFNGNQVFFGTKLGIITFNPNSITQRKVANYPVIVSNLYASGKNIIRKLYDNNILDLTWKENDIIIDLSLLDYTKQNIQFRYKLIGNNNNWSYLGKNQNRVTYTNIPPGKYQFVTQASHNKEQWHHETVFNIIIHPAFWQTWWFKTFTLLLIVILTALIVRKWFLNLLRKEKETIELEKKMALLELDALRSQMNPHFIFNTINSIQGYIIEHDEIETNKYLTSFARLMRLFLESSKKRFILLKDEIDLIKLYVTLEQLRFDDKFDFEIIVGKDIEVTRCYIPSLLLHPIIENAIKHGLIHKKTKGRLLLKITKKDTLIKILIDDDGIGRKQSAFINLKRTPTHKSRGMEMIFDRIKTFNFIEEQKIKIEIIDKEYPNVGTTIILYIPVDQNKTYHHD
ncbi:MAG: two-component regulator propeller domain-containing protein [Flavipsychrobacter sp.]